MKLSFFNFGLMFTSWDQNLDFMNEICRIKNLGPGSFRIHPLTFQPPRLDSIQSHIVGNYIIYWIKMKILNNYIFL